MDPVAGSGGSRDTSPLSVTYATRGKCGVRTNSRMASMLPRLPPLPFLKPNSPPPLSSSPPIPPRHSGDHPTSRRLHSSPSSSSSMPFDQRMQESLSILDLMDAQSIPPDPSLFSTLLTTCAHHRSLHFGRILHRRALLAGIHTDPFVANSLIFLYSNCGHLGIARQLFDEMPVRNVVSWTTVISMYHHAGFHHDALDLYRTMRESAEVKPNAFTYTVALNSCASAGDLDMGIGIHEDVVKDGCEGDEFVIVALVDMYAKCRVVGLAREVFDRMTEPHVEACTAMIEGLTGNGKACEALDLIRRMLRSNKGVKVAREIGFSAMIRPCLMELALRQGQEIHAHIIKIAHNPGLKTLSYLIELYISCNKTTIAYRLSKEMVVKDATLWHKMMERFVQGGLHQEALKVFEEMVCFGCMLRPSLVSLALKACLGLQSLEEGRQIHCRMIKGRCLSKDSMFCDIAELYRDCGKPEEAHKVMER